MKNCGVIQYIDVWKVLHLVPPATFGEEGLQDVYLNTAPFLSERTLGNCAE
jgi:hypothetical protein